MNVWWLYGCMMFYIVGRDISMYEVYKNVWWLYDVWWLKGYMMTYMVNREYVDDRGIRMYDDIQIGMKNHRSVWWHTRMDDDL